MLPLWLLLWPGLCGESMCLPMLSSMIHLWATIRGILFPDLSALSKNKNHGPQVNALSVNVHAPTS
jgi:hypothetical protein